MSAVVQVVHLFYLYVRLQFLLHFERIAADPQDHTGFPGRRLLWFMGQLIHLSIIRF